MCVCMCVLCLILHNAFCGEKPKELTCCGAQTVKHIVTETSILDLEALCDTPLTITYGLKLSTISGHVHVSWRHA